jgi:hypothetical protein
MPPNSLKIGIPDCKSSASKAFGVPNGHFGPTTEQGVAHAVTSRCMHDDGDDPLDDFPLGDGTADTVATVVCP